MPREDCSDDDAPLTVTGEVLKVADTVGRLRDERTMASARAIVLQTQLAWIALFENDRYEHSIFGKACEAKAALYSGLLQRFTEEVAAGRDLLSTVHPHTTADANYLQVFQQFCRACAEGSDEFFKTEDEKPVSKKVLDGMEFLHQQCDKIARGGR